MIALVMSSRPLHDRSALSEEEDGHHYCRNPLGRLVQCMDRFIVGNISGDG